MGAPTQIPAQIQKVLPPQATQQLAYHKVRMSRPSPAEGPQTAPGLSPAPMKWPLLPVKPAAAPWTQATHSPGLTSAP